MNSKYIIILFFTIVSSLTYGQDNDVVIEGKVSFVTSKNIYVKFENTSDINIGDTLYLINTNTPCLSVSNKSSSSVVCSIINDCVVKKEDIVFFKFNSKVKDEIVQEKIQEPISKKDDNLIETKEPIKKESLFSEKIKGRFSVASYSNLSDNRDDRHRLMSRFSINADHINNSKFSVETYLNYRQNFITQENVISEAKTKFFKVYNLALRYDLDSTFSVTLGRKINNKASSLSANDGIQIEKILGKNYIGVIGGFRPDITDFGFNPDLLQYGAYMGREIKNKNIYSQTTLGFAEQRNNNEIDRRYTYFQHSSTIFKKLNLFSSVELDIFNKVNDSINNSPRLTNLYLSTRYRFSKIFNLMLSYDSRKRIIYYETYQTEVERLLEEYLARQGLRARLNVKPFKYLTTGVSYSKRYQNDSDNKSDNIYGYITLSKLPGIGGRLNLTYNLNSSNYLESNIAAIRFSRPLFKQKLNTDFYYRFVNYAYLNNNLTFDQQYFGANLSYSINRTLVLSVSGEYSTYDLENKYRINTRIIKRFYRNNK